MASSATLNSVSPIKVQLQSSQPCKPHDQTGFRFARRTNSASKLSAFSPSSSNGAASTSGDGHRQRSSLESLYCYDKAIPEERIGKPVGISLAVKLIGDNPSCDGCHAKGAVLCKTCSGSGLYVDSILESQGIIVKVRCLGCGGCGNVMCSQCGGRGHL